jgi:hypothetical protein
MGIKSASLSAFGLKSPGTSLWTAGYCLTEQQYRSCLETVLPGLLKDIPIASSFTTVVLQGYLGKISGSGWTLHIQEGELNAKANYMA